MGGHIYSYQHPDFNRKMLCVPRLEMPPSKHMRLGSGLSSVVKSPAISCFDVDLFVEDAHELNCVAEQDLYALFGFPDPHFSHQCSNKMDAF
jgi:hypothetical protein